MPDTYKAVEIKEWGTRDEPATGIAVVERPTPMPGAGEVLVRIFLRPINPSDLFSLAGAGRCQSAAVSICSNTPSLRRYHIPACSCLELCDDTWRQSLLSANYLTCTDLQVPMLTLGVAFAGYYQGFKPDSLPAVPGLEGAANKQEQALQN